MPCRPTSSAIYHRTRQVWIIYDLYQLQHPNFTDRKFSMNRTGVSHLSCSFLDVNLEQTKDTFIASILICVLNPVFSLLTSTGNFIILCVIWKKQELHSPSFILLFCLAVSDLVVALICQPFFVAYHIAEFINNFEAYCAFRIIQSIFSYTTTGVSLATLSGISIDRLLALTLHLRYNHLVTTSRIIATACCRLDSINCCCYF